ncbi:MAG: hypothetical protein AAGK14_06265 [Verrucomicrobiota bacterium]
MYAYGALLAALAALPAVAFFEDITVEIDQDTDKEWVGFYDQLETMLFTIKLKNTTQEVQRGKMWVYVVGETNTRGRKKDSYSMLDIQKMPVKLERYEEGEYQTKEIENDNVERWYSGSSTYYGVMVVIKDLDGNVIVAKSNRQKLDKLTDEIMKTKKGDTFDDD